MLFRVTESCKNLEKTVKHAAAATRCAVPMDRGSQGKAGSPRTHAQCHLCLRTRRSRAARPRRSDVIRALLP